MKLPLTILVAVLAAWGARQLGGRPAARGADGGEPALAELRSAVEGLRAENLRLAQEIERRERPLAPAPATADGPGEEEIGAALERWRAAHPAEAEAVDKGRTARGVAAEAEPDIARVPIRELVALLSREGLTNLDRQRLFQELREAGRIDEYVAEIEKLAAEDPDDPALQVALGNAYLQRLFAVGNTPEAGVWAYKADAAFDAALELDDHGWDARFTKAVALSNWPAFLGRMPEAIEHFEVLLDQQSEVPPRPEFAMTYLFLGNLYQTSGEPAEALATWKAGLALFPGVEDLRRAVELAEQGSSGGG
jgi:tetratricopeptide (TPR) repeat protein